MQQLARVYETENLEELSDVVPAPAARLQGNQPRRPLSSFANATACSAQRTTFQPAVRTSQARPVHAQEVLAHQASQANQAEPGTIHPIQSAPSARFAQMARAAADAATALGLKSPGFMSPPRHKTADRTIRRTAHGQAEYNPSRDCVVAVRIKGRPLAAVQADIVEGVIIANNLTAAQAVSVRTELWRHLTTLVPGN